MHVRTILQPSRILEGQQAVVPDRSPSFRESRILPVCIARHHQPDMLNQMSANSNATSPAVRMRCHSPCPPKSSTTPLIRCRRTASTSVHDRAAGQRILRRDDPFAQIQARQSFAVVSAIPEETARRRLHISPFHPASYRGPIPVTIGGTATVTSVGDFPPYIP